MFCSLLIAVLVLIAETGPSLLVVAATFAGKLSGLSPGLADTESRSDTKVNLVEFSVARADLLG